MKGAVLVAGASGYLGRRVVAELRRRGVTVRALVRAPRADVLSELSAAGADVVAADATRPGSLVGVCDGCFAVISCMAANMRWSSGSPEDVDRDANIALFQEAADTTDRAVASGSGSSSGGRGGSGRGGSGSGGAAAGVRRFLLVATFEGREARAHVPLQRAKEEAVEYVESMAPEHGMAWTILRPTVYFKDFTDLPWQRMQRSRWMLVPGGGTARYNPIDGAELAASVADCVLEPTADRWANREARIGGPQVLTFRDTIYAAAEALGRQRQSVWLIPVPAGLLHALALLAGLLGVLWQPAARLAGALRFLAYSSTHDAVGEVLWGRRTVADHYRDLAAQQAQQQQPEKRAAEVHKEN
ncbi:hypothetical protein ABPG75_010556 [Micractinium tetrahymenae]